VKMDPPEGPDIDAMCQASSALLVTSAICTTFAIIFEPRILLSNTTLVYKERISTSRLKRQVVGWMLLGRRYLINWKRFLIANEAIYPVEAPSNNQSSIKIHHFGACFFE